METTLNPGGNDPDERKNGNRRADYVQVQRPNKRMRIQCLTCNKEAKRGCVNYMCRRCCRRRYNRCNSHNYWNQGNSPGSHIFHESQPNRPFSDIAGLSSVPMHPCQAGPTATILYTPTLNNPNTPVITSTSNSSQPYWGFDIAGPSSALMNPYQTGPATTALYRHTPNRAPWVNPNTPTITSTSNSSQPYWGFDIAGPSSALMNPYQTGPATTALYRHTPNRAPWVNPNTPTITSTSNSSQPYWGFDIAGPSSALMNPYQTGPATTALYRHTPNRAPWVNPNIPTITSTSNSSQARSYPPNREYSDIAGPSSVPPWRSADPQHPDYHKH